MPVRASLWRLPPETLQIQLLRLFRVPRRAAIGITNDRKSHLTPKYVNQRLVLLYVLIGHIDMWLQPGFVKLALLPVLYGQLRHNINPTRKKCLKTCFKTSIFFLCACAFLRSVWYAVNTSYYDVCHLYNTLPLKANTWFIIMDKLLCCVLIYPFTFSTTLSLAPILGHSLIHKCTCHLC